MIKMNKKTKKLIVLGFLFIVLVIGSIVYYNTILSSRLIFSNSFSKLNKELSVMLNPLLTNYEFTNDLTIEGTVSFHITDIQNNDIAVFNEEINNLEINYSYIHNQSDNSTVGQINSTVKEEPLVNLKYINTNDTNYLYLNDIYSKYINIGNLNSSIFNNTYNDYQYLFNQLINAINDNLVDDYFTRKTSMENTPIIEVTLTLNKEDITNIINNVKATLKEDSRASSIIANIDPNFLDQSIRKEDHNLENITIYTRQSIIEDNLQNVTITITNNGETNSFIYNNNNNQKQIIINDYLLTYSHDDLNFTIKDTNGRTLNGHNIEDGYTYSYSDDSQNITFKINNYINNQNLEYNYILTINNNEQNLNVNLNGIVKQETSSLTDDVSNAIKIEEISEADQQLITNNIVTKIIDLLDLK